VSGLADAVERDAVAGRTSVGELGALIDAASWLTNSHVVRVDQVGGKLPIAWTPDGTVARIALLGGGEFVYFSVAEDLTAVELARGLRGEGEASAAIVRELAVQRG
jgi:hypothetical protein